MGMLLAMTQVGCKKPTCNEMVSKMVDCAGKKGEDRKLAEAFKGAIIKQCEEELKDEEVRKITEQTLACTKKKQCGEFVDCVTGVEKANRELIQKRRERLEAARTSERIQTEVADLEKLVREKKLDKALSKCAYPIYAYKGLKSSDAKTKTASKKFYGLCLTGAPSWLIELGKSGNDPYASICNSDSKSYKELLQGSGATELQKKNLRSGCLGLKVAVQVARAKTTLAKQPDMFPYDCQLKDIDELMSLGTPTAKTMALRAATFCYQNVGYKLMAKKSKQRYKYCLQDEKDTLVALAKYKLAKPEQADVIQIWTKVCAHN